MCNVFSLAARGDWLIQYKYRTSTLQIQNKYKYNTTRRTQDRRDSSVLLIQCIEYVVRNAYIVKSKVFCIFNVSKVLYKHLAVRVYTRARVGWGILLLLSNNPPIPLTFWLIEINPLFLSCEDTHT